MRYGAPTVHFYDDTDGTQRVGYRDGMPAPRVTVEEPADEEDRRVVPFEHPHGTRPDWPAGGGLGDMFSGMDRMMDEVGRVFGEAGMQAPERSSPGTQGYSFYSTTTTSLGEDGRYKTEIRERYVDSATGETREVVREETDGRGSLPFGAVKEAGDELGVREGPTFDSPAMHNGHGQGTHRGGLRDWWPWRWN